MIAGGNADCASRPARGQCPHSLSSGRPRHMLRHLSEPESSPLLGCAYDVLLCHSRPIASALTGPFCDPSNGPRHSSRCTRWLHTSKAGERVRGRRVSCCRSACRVHASRPWPSLGGLTLSNGGDLVGLRVRDLDRELLWIVSRLRELCDSGRRGERMAHPQWPSQIGRAHV